MILHLIWAQARNGVIGRNNTLPWRLSEDMAHFRALTMGCPVIMGRKTWDSLPVKFRPLPGRRNIVVTRQPGWQAEGAEAAGSLQQAIALCADAPRVWVTGGAEIYRQAQPLAQVAEVTFIDADFEGDAFAPQLAPTWQETHREKHMSANGLPFSFVSYRQTPSES